MSKRTENLCLVGTIVGILLMVLPGAIVFVGQMTGYFNPSHEYVLLAMFLGAIILVISLMIVTGQRRSDVINAIEFLTGVAVIITGVISGKSHLGLALAIGGVLLIVTAFLTSKEPATARTSAVRG